MSVRVRLEKGKVFSSPVLVYICEALNVIPNKDWTLRRRMLQQRLAQEFDDRLFYLLACTTVLMWWACQEKVNPPGLCALCMIFFSFFFLQVQNFVLLNVCAQKKITLINSKVCFFPPASPLLLITMDLGVAVYFLFLSLVCHHLHMVVFCIHSYVVHIFSS